MKTIRYIGTALILGLLGCKTSHDVTQTVANRTDYVIGQTYQLKKPAFLFMYNKNSSIEIPKLEKLGFSGTPSNLEEFKRRAPSDPQVVGLLQPGDRLRVTKFIESKSATLGRFLEALAIITTGESAGQVVELSMISKQGLPSYTILVNPEYLFPLN